MLLKPGNSDANPRALRCRRLLSVDLRAVLVALLLTFVPAACQPAESPSVAPPTKVLTGAAQQATATPDPEAIQLAWAESPHANTFVVTEEDRNSTCARCHAPINWIPMMDDMPEACTVCKFTIDPPPPKIPEEEWEHIPCKVCHRVDRRGEVEAEFAWLEIAPIDEYATVASSTELCEKCHGEADVADHPPLLRDGPMVGFLCTECHDAHGTAAACAAAGCHDDLMTSPTPAPGHDEDHQAVACVACHDASELEVGPSEDLEMWTTFISRSSDQQSVAYTSHNIQLESLCERCHYPDNPWDLEEDVSTE